MLRFIKGWVFISAMFVATFSYAQEGPFKLDALIVGVTTYAEFDSMYGDGKNNYSTISTDTQIEDELDNYYTSEFIYTRVREVFPDYSSGDVQNYHLTFTSEDARTYLLSQVKIDDFAVNGVVVHFFQDTIVEIAYIAPEPVLRVLLDKYKGEAHNFKEVKKKSACTAKLKDGSNVKDIITNVDLLNKENATWTRLEAFNGLDANCDHLFYGNVKIIDKDKMKIWMEHCIAYMKIAIASALKEKKDKAESTKSKL